MARERAKESFSGLMANIIQGNGKLARNMEAATGNLSNNKAIWENGIMARSMAMGCTPWKPARDTKANLRISWSMALENNNSPTAIPMKANIFRVILMEQVNTNGNVVWFLKVNFVRGFDRERGESHGKIDWCLREFLRMICRMEKAILSKAMEMNLMEILKMEWKKG